MLIGLLWAIIGCERVQTKKEKYPSGRLKARWEVTKSAAGELKNGVYEEWYENKETKLIVNYVDNKEHGIYRSYYKSGQISSEMSFHHGELRGDNQEWYENGQKKSATYYKKGELHGTYQTWDGQGKTVVKAKFKKGVCVKGDCSQLARSTAFKM